MQKEHELAATERMGAEQNRRMKWLRATRIGLRFALVCCLALMLIFTFMVLGQEYYFAKLEAEGISITRSHPYTPYYIAMIQLGGLSMMLTSLLLIFRMNWQAWSAALTGQSTEKEERKHENH